MAADPQTSSARELFAGFTALAHRGGRIPGAQVENSMRAFSRAIDLGYRCLETDVRTTADGVPIIFHDATLDRVTDADGAIADLPWATVRLARIGGTEPIPTLDTLLDSFGQGPGDESRVVINIDLKDEGSVRPLAEAIRRHGAERRVCVGSFNARRLRHFRQLMGPAVATSAASPAVIAMLLPNPLRRTIGALVPDTVRAEVFQIPVSHPVGRYQLPIVTPRFLERAHTAGRPVHVWTINDRQEMADLIDLGVDGIVTDEIDLLRDVLIERSLW